MLKSFIFLLGKMETINDCLRKKNTCVMALIIVYENNGVNAKKVYRVLSCVIYSLIKHYVCMDYQLCESKTLNSLSSKPTF